MKMRFMLKLLSVAVFSSVLISCASKEVTSNEFLLMDNAPAESRDMQAANVSIQLMPIEVANFLTGNEIVLVSKQGEVHRSQQNLWAEPLSSQLDRLTLNGLIKRLPSVHWYGGQTAYTGTLLHLTIEVDAFYADLNGQAHISGRWKLMTETGTLASSQEFSISEPLSKSGYPALVKTLGDMWFSQVVSPMSKGIEQALDKK